MVKGRLAIIGIDLGMTYSCIRVFRNDQVNIIQNEHGYHITPSCVAFANEETLIGETALYKAIINTRQYYSYL
ncbi:HSP70-domain-containing protein [Piromyces finnis]|uniref:HSP70-domain-containing protein n=1 Tax=Piromyces finnis TaxID=1754191 RepID=A0A1Y1UX48_9FUNG|nr:HSP70-domain-containing protein [Piromyces finnis]|eukprot:ORX42759.1 HSP70-domain-containing protein [Piromyces finnis]